MSAEELVSLDLRYNPRAGLCVASALWQGTHYAGVAPAFGEALARLIDQLYLAGHRWQTAEPVMPRDEGVST